MKKLLLATMLFAAIGCTKSDLPEATNPDVSMQKPTKKIVLRASAGAETKLGFEDNDKEGIAVTWAKGDKFSLYNKTDGNLVATFELDPESIGKQSGEFTSTDQLIVGDTYTVVYPAIEAAVTLDDYKAALAKINQNQIGNGTLNHMSKVCGMEMEDYTYTYTVDSPDGISFKHTKAIMTLKLGKPAGYDPAKDGAPTGISYTNHVGTYNLTLTDVDDWTDAKGITAYIMIDPTEQPVHETDAFITVTTANGVSYMSKAVISKSYEAGMRYTANREGDSFIRGYTLANADKIPLDETDIVILDAVDDTYTAAKFSDLRLNLKHDSRTAIVNLTMPNATVIPGAAFFDSIYLGGIDLPKVEKISNAINSKGAFYSCKSLTTVNIPLVTLIGESVFFDCYALTTIAAPELISIGNYAFYNCTALTTIDAPKLTSIGNSAFSNCTALTTIDVSKVTSIGDSAFSYCTALRTIDAPKLTSIGNSAFSYCTALTTIDAPKLTSIGNYAFFSCSSLTIINAPVVTSIGGSAFSKIGTSLSVIEGTISLCTSRDGIMIEFDIFNSAAVGKYDLTLGSGVSGIGAFVDVNAKTWTICENTYTFKSITVSTEQ